MALLKQLAVVIGGHGSLWRGFRSWHSGVLVVQIGMVSAPPGAL